MACKYELWKEWIFSEELQQRINDFVTGISKEKNCDSEITKNWLRLYNFSHTSHKLDSADVKENTFYSNEETTINSLIQLIESNKYVDESELRKMPVDSLSSVFNKLQLSLSKNGFSNFCKIIRSWEDPSLLNVCFDILILKRLQKEEEATLSTINDICELAKYKPERLCKVIISLIINDSYDFNDKDLLSHVFDILPDTQKQEVIIILTKTEKFKENYWSLLQAILGKISDNFFHDIVILMKEQCEKYANSQVFSKFMVQICNNLQSDTYKDVLLHVVEKNKTILKRQAQKYLSSL